MRDLNDTHHAVDAYLNIVSGVSLTDRYGGMRFIKASKDKEKHSLNMERYISSLIQIKEGQKTELGELIDQTSRRHDFLLTYRFNYSDDAFYNLKASKKKAGLAPLHDNLPSEKYGGYVSMNREFSYIATVSSGKKVTRYLLGVPHLFVSKQKIGTNIYEKLLTMVPHKETAKVTIDTKHPIALNATLKKDGIQYLCTSFNEVQMNLKPITPIFLTKKSEFYLSNLMKYVDKYPNISDENNEYEFKINRGNVGPIKFTEKQSIEVAQELINKAKQDCFSYCPMISKLRSINAEEMIHSKSLSEQLKIIKSLIGVFTRKSEILSDKNNFRKSRGAILQEGLLLCSDSITGLYHTERKL